MSTEVCSNKIPTGGVIKRNCALFLLHGFTGTPDSFSFLRSQLENETVSILSPAIYGHSGYLALGGKKIGCFVDEVDRLAEFVSENCAPIHLVGYSLGGRLALGLLIRHPKMFRSATLISARRGLDNESERITRRLADLKWGEILEREGLEAFFEKWEKQPIFESLSSVANSIKAAERECRKENRAIDLANAMRILGLAEMPSWREEARNIVANVTLVAGSLDAKFCALADEMARLIPGSRKIVLEGAGHNLLLERPAAIADIVRSQLANCFSPANGQ